MSRPSDFMEHQVSPWLRLIVPVMLALIMFIMNSMNKNIEAAIEEQQKQREMLSELAERVRANETAIRIYHGPPRVPGQ